MNPGSTRTPFVDGICAPLMGVVSLADVSAILPAADSVVSDSQLALDTVPSDSPEDLTTAVALLKRVDLSSLRLSASAATTTLAANSATMLSSSPLAQAALASNPTIFTYVAPPLSSSTPHSSPPPPGDKNVPVSPASTLTNAPTPSTLTKTTSSQRRRQGQQSPCVSFEADDATNSVSVTGTKRQHDDDDDEDEDDDDDDDNDNVKVDKHGDDEEYTPNKQAQQQHHQQQQQRQEQKRKTKKPKKANPKRPKKEALRESSIPEYEDLSEAAATALLDSFQALFELLKEDLDDHIVHTSALVAATTASTDTPSTHLLDKLAEVGRVVARLRIQNLMGRVDADHLCRLMHALDTLVCRAMRRPLVALHDGRLAYLGDEELPITNSLRAVAIICDVLSARDVPDRVFIEDTIDHAVHFVKFHLQHSIFPVQNPSAAVPLADDYDLTRVFSTVNDISIATLSRRIARVYDQFALLISASSGRRLTEVHVRELCTMAIEPFFVTDLEDLQQAALPLASAISTHYASHRVLLFDYILEGLPKLPTTKTPRHFHLSPQQSMSLSSSSSTPPDSNRVQMTTALVAQLIQSAMATFEAHSFSATDTSTDDWDTLETSVLQGYSAAAVVARSFLVDFVSKVSSARTEDAARMRSLLDLFVEDLLRLCGLPEWPAAEVLLDVFAFQLMFQLKRHYDSSAATAADAFTTTAIDYLSNMVAHRGTVMQQGQGEVCESTDPELDLIAMQNRLLNELLERSHVEPLALAARRFLLGRWLSASAPKQDQPDRSPVIKLNFEKFDDDDDDDDQVAGEEHGALDGKGKKSLSDDEDSLMKGIEGTVDALRDRRRVLVAQLLSPSVIIEPDTRSSNTDRAQQAKRIGNMPWPQLLQQLMPVSCDEQRNAVLRHVFMLLKDRPKLRAKAMRALSKIVVSSPSLLDEAHVKRALQLCLEDSSTSVREAAVDLVGKFAQLSSSPQVASQYLTLLISRADDSGVSVRRRVVATLKETCKRLGETDVTKHASLAVASSSTMTAAVAVVPPSSKISELYACLLVRGAQDDTESVQQLALKSLRDLLFGTPDGPCATDDSSKVSQSSSASSRRKSGSSSSKGAPAFVDEFAFVDQAVDDLWNVEAVTKAAHAVMHSPNNQRFVVARADELVGLALLGDGMHLGALESLVRSVVIAAPKRTCTELTTLQGVCQALVDELHDALSSYDDTLSQTATASEKARRLESRRLATLQVLQSFAKCRPMLLTRHVSTLQPYLSMKESPSNADISMACSVTALMEEVVPTLSRSTETLRADLVRNLLSQDPRIVEASIKCLVAIVGALQRHEALMVSLLKRNVRCLEEHHPHQGVARTDAAMRLISRAMFTGGKLCQYYDYASTGGALRTRLIDLLFAYEHAGDAPIKRRALGALGSIVVRTPSLLVTSKMRTLYNNSLASSDQLMVMQILGNLTVLLRDEEQQMRMRDAKDGAALAASVNATGVTALDLDIGGYDDDMDTRGDSGVGGQLAREHLDRILGFVVSPIEAIRRQAYSVVEQVLHQGLVNPRECIATLIALETDRVHCKRAFTELQRLNEKYPSFVAQQAVQGVKVMFQFHQQLTKHQQHHPQPVSQLAPIVPGRLLSRLYGLLSSRSTRRSFLGALLNLFTATTTNVALLAFVAENVALLAYGEADEPLFVVYTIDKLVATHATNVLSDCRELFGCARRDFGDDDDGYEEDDVDTIVRKMNSISSPVDAQQVAKWCDRAMGQAMLLDLKACLKRIHRLNESRCRAFQPGSLTATGRRRRLSSSPSSPSTPTTPVAGSAAMASVGLKNAGISSRAIELRQSAKGSTAKLAPLLFKQINGLIMSEGMSMIQEEGWSGEDGEEEGAGEGEENDGEDGQEDEAELDGEGRGLKRKGLGDDSAKKKSVKRARVTPKRQPAKKKTKEKAVKKKETKKKPKRRKRYESDTDDEEEEDDDEDFVCESD